MKVDTNLDNETVCTLSTQEKERLATARTIFEKLAFHARFADDADGIAKTSDLLATIIKLGTFTFPSSPQGGPDD